MKPENAYHPHEDSSLVADAVELTPEYQAVTDKAESILKEKYDIDWRTPAETNPDILFD